MSNYNFEKKTSKKEMLKILRQKKMKERRSEEKISLLIKFGAGLLIFGVIALLFYLAKISNPPSSSTGSLTSLGKIKLGDKAPDFSLPDTNGKIHSLADHKGKNILLYFQEGVMCAPCWKQITTMQAKFDQFSQLETAIISISTDDAATWEPVLRAENITKIPVLVDLKREVSSSYGVLHTKSQMHHDRPGHTFILVDKTGKIKWIGDYPEMTVTEEEILEVIRNSIGT